MIDNAQPVVEQPTQDPQPQIEPSAPAPERSETETRARAMGWVPQEEFRGPSEKWRDADEFVKRGEEELPILRERNRDMARKHAEFEERLARQERDFADRVQRQERMASLALQRQRENLEAQYEAAKREAVNTGDMQRYDQLNRDQRSAVHEFDKQISEAVPQRQQQQGLPPHIAAEVSTWQQQNTWFNADPILNQYAQMVHMNLNQTKPGLSIRDNLAEVSREVRARFPEKFSVGNGRPAAVESGSGQASGATRRGKGVSELPSEARRIGEEFVRAGAFKDMAAYAKDYWSQDGAAA